MALIRVPVRYLSMHSDKLEDIVESNIKYTETVWEIDVKEAALVLVDIWNRHLNKSHMERCLEIVENKIAPVVQVARKVGMTVIHAPSAEVAKKYPQSKKYASDEESNSHRRQPPDWPLIDFRKRTGKYSRYARRHFHNSEILNFARDYYEGRLIPGSVEPAPEDFVVATGKQLHRLLKDRKILHLFYVGFATNICVVNKDYGINAMNERGYNIILLRDCTTGIETNYTIENFLSTNLAIQQIEHYNSSTTSEELMEACIILLKKDFCGGTSVNNTSKEPKNSKIDR